MTTGRRPDGPGVYWHWYTGTVSVGGYTHYVDCPVEVRYPAKSPFAFVLSLTRSAIPLDAMPGTFTPLSKPIAMPQPDWSQAPPWAKWWAVASDGRSQGYFESEPKATWHQSTRSAGWMSWDAELWLECRLPIGIDWRTTLTKRPEASDE